MGGGFVCFFYSSFCSVSSKTFMQKMCIRCCTLNCNSEIYVLLRNSFYMIFVRCQCVTSSTHVRYLFLSS